MQIKEVVEGLYPYAYSVVSDSSDLAVDAFRKHLPFSVSEVPSGREVNGWLVPNNWTVKRAEIWFEGELLLDGTLSPLGVGLLSPSFSGRVDRQELMDHLVSDNLNPRAVPYHWANLYRPGHKDWFFCVTVEFLEKLPPGPFEVRLVTEEKTGSMKLLEYVLPGEDDQQILINAHNCHPWQANDDISGCAVGIAIFLELQKLQKRKFTYRLLIAPELIGTAHWLERQSPGDPQIAGVVLLKAVGSPGPIRLQHSFEGNSQLDKAAFLAVSLNTQEFDSGPFRSIYGNDETVFDSPGYEIPSITFTRMGTPPFLGYHTDADTPEGISEQALVETRDLVLDTIRALESNVTLKFSHKGLVSLSSPKYDLYIKHSATPGLVSRSQGNVEQRWHLFMNCLPRELTGENSAVDLAYKYGLPAAEVAEYIVAWEAKGLGEFV